MNGFHLPQKFTGSDFQPFMLKNNEKDDPLVLLFSKDFEVRALLQAFLNVWNCRVCEANSEANLVQVAENKNPSLILFDLSLAFDDDLEILRRARQIAAVKNLPIIVLSGHARFRDSDVALQAGANEYLLKPIDFEKLESSVKKYCSDCEYESESDFGGNV